MLNHIGNYSLYIALIVSIIIIFQSANSLQKVKLSVSDKIFSLISVQSIMIIISWSVSCSATLHKDRLPL